MNVVDFKQLRMAGRLQQQCDFMRVALSVASLLCGCLASGATLEKLSLDDMSRKSTLIVRGRIAGCVGEQRGSVIYTRCRVNVTERWKGAAENQVDLLIPGGAAGGLIQTFTGTPKFNAGAEYVLFLWSGRSGVLQVIGLSQGVFDVKVDAKGAATATRDASAEVMLDAAGHGVDDARVRMTVEALRKLVALVVGDTSK
jgi:hypothetical protein